MQDSSSALLRCLLLELLHGLIQILSQSWAAQTQGNQREDSFHTASVKLLRWFGSTFAQQGHH